MGGHRDLPMVSLRAPAAAWAGLWGSEGWTLAPSPQQRASQITPHSVTSTSGPQRVAGSTGPMSTAATRPHDPSGRSWPTPAGPWNLWRSLQAQEQTPAPSHALLPQGKPSSRGAKPPCQPGSQRVPSPMPTCSVPQEQAAQPQPDAEVTSLTPHAAWAAPVTAEATGSTA